MLAGLFEAMWAPGGCVSVPLTGFVARGTLNSVHSGIVSAWQYRAKVAEMFTRLEGRPIGSDLQEQFATRKLVERAKSLLTTKMGLTEPEAFRWIQKTSMDRRLSMREVAETIINQVN